MVPKENDAILVFLPSLSGGGAERVMVTLANGFFRNGHPVDLVLAKEDGPYVNEVASGVRIIDLKASRVMTALTGLVRHIRATRPSVVFSTQSHANLVAVWASRLALVPIRVVIREANTASKSATNSLTLRGRFLPFLMRRFYPWADVVVAPSQGVLDDLRRNFDLPAEKVRLLYNPSISDELLVRAEAPLIHPWFESGQPPVLLGVGRLTRQKDFSTLIRAFARVRQQKKMRLMILGEGEERGALETLSRELGVADQVSLPGFVANPFNYMRRAALFVLSSAWEGLPNVLIQAMACGVPVIAADCPSGPAEILQNGEFGTLVPVGDVAALVSAIDAALEQEQKTEGLREKRFKRAMFFSEKKNVMEYLNVIFGHLDVASKRNL